VLEVLFVIALEGRLARPEASFFQSRSGNTRRSCWAPLSWG
jgi:hypothetical protein